MTVFKTLPALRNYVKANLRRETKIDDHITSFVLDWLDEAWRTGYNLGYNAGMCDTCKTTNQPQRTESARDYDLSHPERTRDDSPSAPPGHPDYQDASWSRRSPQPRPHRWGR